MRTLANISLLSATFCFASCRDNVTTRFDDIQQAQTAGAFERGWLPPILPPSTKNIIERNDLDTNAGEGYFTFAPEEVVYFSKKGAETTEVSPASGSPQQKYEKDGFGFVTFSTETTSWLIAVHPDGRGAYWVETKK